MADQGKQSDMGPTPWGSEPIRGLNYDFLDIVKPPDIIPEPVMPEVAQVPYSREYAEDFYRRIRGKVMAWAEGAGAGKEITSYVMLVPDMVALFGRLMFDPRVSAQFKAEFAAASAYIILPIDLMPEAVLGPAGYIEDAVIGALILSRMVKTMGTAGSNVIREHWDGDQDILRQVEEIIAKAETFVSGPVMNGIKTFIASVAETAKSSVGQGKPSGPVVEGSARPILPDQDPNP